MTINKFLTLTLLMGTSFHSYASETTPSQIVVTSPIDVTQDEAITYIEETFRLLKESSPKSKGTALKTIAKLIRDYSTSQEVEKLSLINHHITSNYEYVLNAYYQADRTFIQNMIRYDVVKIISTSDQLIIKTIDDIILEASQNIRSKANLEVSSNSYLRSSDGYPRATRAWDLVEVLIRDNNNIPLFNQHLKTLRELYMSGHHFITMPVSNILLSLNSPEALSILHDGLKSRDPQVRGDSASALANSEKNKKEDIAKGLYGKNIHDIDAAMSYIGEMENNGLKYIKQLNAIAWNNSLDKYLRGRAINTMGQVGLPHLETVDYLINIIDTSSISFLKGEALFALQSSLVTQNNQINSSHQAYSLNTPIGRISDYNRNKWIIEAIPSVAKSLSDENKQVRKAAILTLGEAGNTAYVVWQRLIETYPNNTEFYNIISESIKRIHDTILVMALDTSLKGTIRIASIQKLGNFSADLWRYLSTNEQYQPLVNEIPRTSEYLIDIIQYEEDEIKIAALKSLANIFKTYNNISRQRGIEPTHQASWTKLNVITPIAELLESEHLEVKNQTIILLGLFGHGAKFLLPELEDLTKTGAENQLELNKTILKIKNNDI